jgi:hypothetical protein
LVEDLKPPTEALSAPFTGWRIFGVFLLAGWTLTLFLPVAKGFSGLWILLLGWMSLFGFQLGYAANIALFLGVRSLIARAMPTKIFSLALAGFTLATVASAALWDGTIPNDIRTQNIKPFGVGYYVWFPVVAIAGLAPLFRFFISNHRKSLGEE